MSDISDLFPTFPALSDPDFAAKIFAKQEYRELAQEGISGEGWFNHQEFIGRFLAPHTGYKELLINHGAGTGKTRSLIRLAFEYMNTEGYGRTIILTPGPKIQKNIKKEFEKISYFAGAIQGEEQYRTRKGRLIALGRRLNEYFEFYGYAEFANMIRGWSDEKIRNTFSNRVIALDEVHRLRKIQVTNRIKGEETTVPRLAKRATKRRKADEVKRMYGDIHRFLHVVENCVKIGMSATPAVDNALELVSILNLLLPLDQQLDTRETRRVLNTRDPARIEEYFAPYINGRVSYVAQGGTFPNRIDVGVPFQVSQDVVINMPVKTHNMSDFQYDHYRDTLIESVNTKEDDTLNDDEEERISFSLDKEARDALNFVFPELPDKELTGYSDFIYVDETGKVRSRQRTFLNLLRDLDRLATLSSKYADIVREVISNPTECAFIYQQYIKGSGAHVLGLCFEAQGYEQYSGQDPITPRSSKRKRYAFLTHDTKQEEYDNILKAFNMPENINGQYLQIVIGTPVTGEGVSFLNTRQVHIVQAAWNEATFYQALNRVFRADSLLTLPENERNIKVYAHASIYDDPEDPTNSDHDTLDIRGYLISQNKGFYINLVQQVMKKYSVDCYVNAYRNQKLEQYECAGQDIYPIDYSSYLLYYAEEAVQELITRLRLLFLHRTQMTFEEIKATLPEYGDNVIITALNRIIQENRFMQNRLGYTNYYLRSSEDLFYLQAENNIGNSVSDIWNAEYSILHIFDTGKTFVEYTRDYIVDSIESWLENTRDAPEWKFQQDFLNLPMNMKIVFLENALTDPDFGGDRRRIVLALLSANYYTYPDSNCVVHIMEYFSGAGSYGANVSHLDPKGKLRIFCFTEINPEWHYVSEEEEIYYINDINEIISRKENAIADKSKVYGIYNTSDNEFRIKDLLQHTRKVKKDGSVDRRSNATGFVCRTATKKKLLPYIRYLEVPAPLPEDRERFEKMNPGTKRYTEYWKNKSVEQICTAIRNYLYSKDLVLTR